MKITTFLLFLSMFCATAENSFSQNARVSISKSYVRLDEVLDEIESQTDYLFLYNNQVNTSHAVSIDVKQTPVRDILNDILDKETMYAMEGTNIVLAKKGSKMTPGIQQQEQGKITGTVKDVHGEPLIGVNVSLKGTSQGAVTDLDGHFSLAAKPKDVLVFSYLGYVAQEFTIQTLANINITMQEDTKQLSEVVVVGFGTQKKINLTGAVGMIDAEVIESRPVQNVSQALQGVIPGLNFSVGNGGGTLDNPLKVNIRGTGTIGAGSGSSPLILIDGIEGDMNTINPNDIETISVLKDAASASIYGARASFGVILITTKKGKSGRTNVNYSNNFRFTDALPIPEMMDSYQFAQYFNAAAANAGQSAVFNETVMQRIKDYRDGKITTVSADENGDRRWDMYEGANANTDWFSEVYRDWVPSQEHNLSISGGSEKITYRVSGSFLDQNGLIRFGKDKLNRYTVDAKISARLTDWITVDYMNKWTREEYQRPTYMTPLFFHNIARRWPTNPVYDDNGFLFEGMELIQMKEGGKQNRKKNFYTQQLVVVLEPLKDWFIHLDGNMKSKYDAEHYGVLPIYAHYTDGSPYLTSWDGRAVGSSRIYDYNTTEDYFSTNIYTDYSKTINSHYFKVMAGFNAELTKRNYIGGRGDRLISPTTPYLGQTQAEARVYGGAAENSVAGFFGRINYNYMDKYMIELNGRYDGSSRFINDKRWGFFPSLSAGWNIAREEFFGSLAESISTLKFRGSWGQLGNTNTEDAWYPFYQTMPTGSGTGSWIVNGVRPNTASLPGIVSSLKTWETIESWDVGLDWAALNNRLTGSFDYFTRYTYDMIGPAPELPSALGAAPPQINNSDMKTYGFELELSWRDRINGFSYGAKLVLSDVLEKIIRYPNDAKTLNTYYNGMMRGNIWGYTTVGIAQSQAEMDAHLQKNKPSWGSSWSAGDIMYADLNGDGVVNEGGNTLDNPGDRKIIGNSLPRYNFGITLDAAWKGFDFSIFLQGIGKRDYMLGGPYFWGASGGMWQSAGFKQHWDFWRPEGDPLGANPNAYYPRASFDGSKNQSTQTGYLQNAAYIRMKNIQFGYTLPSLLVGKIGLSSVRVYLSGDNLLTASEITGIFDPETIGADYGDGKLYPLCKVISFGLNVNF